MSKLIFKEYCSRDVKEYAESSDLNGYYGYNKGFDKALNMNLPVLFTKWKDENFHKVASNTDKKYYPNVGQPYYELRKLVKFEQQQTFSAQELYDLWLENVLKLEDLQ